MRRRPKSRLHNAPPIGTLLEVCAICSPASQGPHGGPELRPVGLAQVNPDNTITAWLDALPCSSALLLRPCPTTEIRQHVAVRDPVLALHAGHA